MDQPKGLSPCHHHGECPCDGCEDCRYGLDHDEDPGGYDDLGEDD